MHECYAMQILETEKTQKKKKKQTNKEQWSPRITIKHKDHVRRTQFD